MSTGTENNEANAEVETYIVIFEAQINKCSTLNHDVFFLLKVRFLFHLFF